MITVAIIKTSGVTVTIIPINVDVFMLVFVSVNRLLQ